MERDPHYARIGLFVVLSFLAAVSFFFIISKWDYQDRNNLYAIFFDGDVTGLRVNEEVRYQGIPIGKVKRISIPTKHINKVMVVVSIKKPALIRQDTIATIEAQGLTGFTFVQIRGSTKDSPVLKIKVGDKYPVIRSSQSNISSVVAEMPKLLMRIDDIANRVITLISSEAIRDFQKTLKHLNTLTGQLADTPNGLQATVTQIKKTATSLDQASSDFSKLLDDNRSQFNRFSQEGLSQITDAAHKANNLMESLEQITQSVNASPLSFLQKSQSKGYQLEGVAEK